MDAQNDATVPPESFGLATFGPPLAGLRVVEYSTDPAGEMTGLQLSNLGAVVVKVEPPGGAPSRHSGPFVHGVPDIERSLAYWYYNVGKQSVVLDIDTTEGRKALDALLVDADVFISTFHPTEIRRLGLDLDLVARNHPRLVLVSITPFGLTGPWKDYLSSDLVGMAASGLLVTSGYDDHAIPPIRPGGDQTFHVAASFANIAVMLGLTQRDVSGCGGLIDVSMHEAAGLTVELANPFWFYPQVVVQRQTCRHAQPVPTQSALFECSDGRFIYFAFIVAETKAWNALVEWMTSKDLAVDLGEEKYADVAFRQQNFDHIQTALECFFALHPADDLYHEGQARGLPIGVVNAPEDLYLDEQLHAREFFVPLIQAGFGEVLHPAPVLRFSAFAPVVLTGAPALGSDTEAARIRIETS